VCSVCVKQGSSIVSRGVKKKKKKIDIFVYLTNSTYYFLMTVLDILFSDDRIRVAWQKVRLG
jgi:hypothetical protein